MEIPLNYYRILGVPIKANNELLTQAYYDRSLQLPHREYSQYAIVARKKLLDQAYEVLCDPEKSKKYNEQFLAPNDLQSTTDESEIEAKTTIETEEELKLTTEKSDQSEASVKTETTNKQLTTPTYSPSLEISEDLLIGALLILQELGEYEQVLKLAQPYLEGDKHLNTPEDNAEKIQATWNDLILTISLSYVELGREQWQLGEYELAFQSQEKALNLLKRENLFISLQEEIDNDLHKLKPYLIVEILKNEHRNIYKRQQAIHLLKEILNDRGGIEGQGLDKTGLNLDEFLLFIQQVRVYLTIIEQQELFEEEAKRPSASASYLAVYALIARGFLERQPAFIVRAKNILISLTQRQDVYLEQAICSLLLGQTEEAEFALTQSQEEEAIEYIKQHSEGSEDLLPGLCLYGEKWLQTEVFSQFSDLNNQTSSLKEYFADSQVQNYLEKLYVNPLLKKHEYLEESELTDQEYPETAWHDEELNIPHFSNYYDQDESSNSDANVLTLVDAERETDLANSKSLVSFESFLNSNLDDNNHSKNDLLEKDKTRSIVNQTKEKFTWNLKNTNLGKNKNLLILILLLILGAGLAILIYQLAFNKKEENLVLSISESLVEIPKNATLSSPPPGENSLDTQTALELINSWLSAKEKATGPQYEIDAFKEILSEPLLSRWRGNAQSLKNRNAYLSYEHKIGIESVKINPNNPNQAIIVANVHETAQYYQNGILNKSESYDEKLKVKYDMIKNNNRWLIKDIKLIN